MKSGMDLRKTIAELYEEKTRLDRVIASLEQLGELPSPCRLQRPGEAVSS